MANFACEKTGILDVRFISEGCYAYMIYWMLGKVINNLLTSRSNVYEYMIITSRSYRLSLRDAVGITGPHVSEVGNCGEELLFDVSNWFSQKYPKDATHNPTGSLRDIATQSRRDIHRIFVITKISEGCLYNTNIFTIFVI